MNDEYEDIFDDHSQYSKKYRQLKARQKERIGTWTGEIIRAFYEENGRWPEEYEDDDFIVTELMKHVSGAGIRISEYEIYDHYTSCRTHLINKQKKKLGLIPLSDILIIERLPGEFSVCKVMDYSKVDLSISFTFVGTTDEEYSLVCSSDNVPDNTIAREDGWKGFRVKGQLDFSLTGILNRITTALKKKKISLFAVSTYNTDYVFVKKENYEQALKLVKGYGFSVTDE